MAGREPDPNAEERVRQNFTVGDGDTLVSLIATFDEVAAADPGHHRRPGQPGGASPAARGALVPQNPDGYSARWILLHVLEELARHAGHADILREHIDGATMYELMAGVEGWPETEWIKPWRPAARSASV